MTTKPGATVEPPRRCGTGPDARYLLQQVCGLLAEAMRDASRRKVPCPCNDCAAKRHQQRTDAA